MKVVSKSGGDLFFDWQRAWGCPAVETFVNGSRTLQLLGKLRTYSLFGSDPTTHDKCRTKRTTVLRTVVRLK
jgi:hypothetical protein